MIFEELTLTDFRQFAGTQSVKFATDPLKNITVIHGFNGSGKTTILNAFTWLLYGECSPDFEEADRLESESSFAGLAPGGKLVTEVKAVFRDGDRKFTAVRTMSVEKDNNGSRRVTDPGKLRVDYIDELGEMEESRNPQDMLEQMLPKRLYPFFFFNGERIERLAGAAAFEEIGQGIRTLLDIELFDRAVSHLGGEISRRLQQEIAKHAGQEGLQAQANLDALTVQREQLEQKVQQMDRNRAALVDERDTIDAKLATMPELAKWLAERKAADEKAASIRREMKQRKVELAREFSRNAYLLLVPDVLQTAKAVLEGSRKKGEIPGPIKRQFVEDLLGSHQCICNRSLLPDTDEYRAVDEWRKKTLSDALESAVTVTKARIESFDQRSEDCVATLKELQRIRDELSTQLKRTEEELSELSGKIGDREHGEEPEKLERRRRAVHDQISTMEMDIKLTRRDLSEIEDKIQTKQREIKTLKDADEEGKLGQRRLDAVSNVLEALKKIREIRYEELREDLSQQLGEVWSGIAIKDYQARLDNDFRLRLTKDIGGQEEPVRGASTGEKQVLSLAFVGALSAKARSTFEQSKQAKHLFRGGLYPLVIDSAFGSLESEYRRDVAKWIPTLSPQVILMVSQSQYRQEVEQELLPRVGKEWILKCETRKNSTRDISILGRSYPYVLQAVDGFERTTFVEVEL
ncbi:MAG TPA: AAA family ATPase [Gemmataceae bacterium]|nr:AAA family ATPase [Gemmataceae bacterium]